MRPRHRWSSSGLGARGRCDLPLFSAAFLSLHCLLISRTHPLPGALLSSPCVPAPNSRGSLGEGPHGPPCAGPGSGKVGAAGGQEGGRWRGLEGGVRDYKSRPTALLFNTLLQRVVSETVN